MRKIFRRLRRMAQKAMGSDRPSRSSTGPRPSATSRWRWEAECMKRYGWYAHYVDGHSCADCAALGEVVEPTGWPEGLMNSHTHGFLETYKHDDFQVVLAMSQSTVHSLFHELADRVKDGATYLPDTIVSGQLVKWSDPLRQAREPMRVQFVRRHEGGRPVLRVLLPDEEGKLPDEAGCDPAYAAQLDFDSDYHGSEVAP